MPGPLLTRSSQPRHRLRKKQVGVANLPAELIPGSDGRVGFTSLETRKWGRALLFTEHLPSQALCWTVYMSFSRQKSMGR